MRLKTSSGGIMARKVFAVIIAVVSVVLWPDAPATSQPVAWRTVPTSAGTQGRSRLLDSASTMLSASSKDLPRGTCMSSRTARRPIREGGSRHHSRGLRQGVALHRRGGRMEGAGVRLAACRDRAIAGREPASDYSAQFMEAVFTPGMASAAHVHSGPEAFYDSSRARPALRRRKERRSAAAAARR